MADQDRDIHAIFNEAVGLESEAERSRYLDQACQGDPQVRGRVEGLLRAHSDAGNFLWGKSPKLAPTIDQPITEQPGNQIGPYKLLQKIGEGGMGVVYMAEQKEPVKRRVALKIIKPGMDTQQVIARFEAERQALAMMDHPNIAKVLDAGQTELGRPYFVMELVNGLPVTKYCDEQHLTPKERLELFIPICQAVQHAHQKGIIHRDLKPSNILVALYDGQPVPKVIDFGVVKATSQTLTEKTMFTQLGQVVGTLEYMSPEQAERNQLDIDTRSDIYSLGVVLYELLTGDTPFDGQRLRSAAFDEMLRIIREEEPPRPSAKLSSSHTLPSVAANRKIEPKRLSVLVRGELDWIVMKALEKDRARRYETATGFVNDIQRYMNDEAVVACPPSRAYRFRKFARRNRSQLATASVLALALLVAMGGVGWAVRDRAAERAEVARERADRQQKITTQVELLLADVDQLAGAQRWEDALATAIRAKAVLAGSNVAGAVSERVEATSQELEFVARLAEIRIESSAWIEKGGERTARPGKGVEVPAWFDRKTWNFDNFAAARSYRTAFREFGVDVEALPAAEALARLRKHPRIALPLAIALDQFVYHLSFSGVDETTWRPLLDVARGLDPDPLRNQLRAVWRQEVTPELQSALRKLVDAFEVQKHGAETAIRLAIALQRAELPELQEQILRQAQQVFPGDYWLNQDLGRELLDQPPYTEAARFTTAALAIKPNSVGALVNLGNALRKQDKLDEAIACHRKALEIDPKLPPTHLGLGNALADQGKPDAAIACYRKALELFPDFASAHNNLGSVYYDQGKLDEAIVCFRQTLELDPKHVFAHINLGNALKIQDKLDEAIECYQKALEIDPDFAPAHRHLGIALYKQDKLDEAIACFRKALELDPKCAHAHVNLGNALKAQGKLDEAIACFRKALEVDPNDASAYSSLGVALLGQGELDEAIACFRQVLELDPKCASSHVNLGIALADQGKPDEAIACYRQALEVDPNDASAYSSLGVALSDQGKLDEAITCYHKALELDPKLAFVHYNLGNALADQGKPDEAIACYRQALELDPKLAFVHYNLGNALADQGKPDEAIACYRNALEVDPQYAQAHHNLGNILADQRKLDEAIACYRKAIEIDPKSVFARHNLGMALYKQKKLDEAIACFRNALEVDPNDAQAHRNLGNVLQDQGKLDEAIECFRTAIEIDPNNAQDHSNLGLALFHQEKLDEAIKCYRKAIELASGRSGSGSRFLWSRCLDIEFARGASADAVQKLVAEAEVALGRPNSLNLVFQQAASYLLSNCRGQYEDICRETASRFSASTDAKELYTVARTAALAPQPVLETGELVEMASRAVEESGAPWHQHVLGLCLLRDGQRDAAIDRFNQSLRHRWVPPLNWLGLAIAHAADGRDDQSQEYLTKAQEWFRQNPLEPTSMVYPPDRLECQLLLREAEQLIHGSSPDEDNATEKTP